MNDMYGAFVVLGLLMIVVVVLIIWVASYLNRNDKLHTPDKK